MSDVGLKGRDTSSDVGLETRVTTSDLGDGKNALDVATVGAVSLLNSTTTPLASGATYTGTGERNDFPQVGIMVKTDNGGVLYFDFSNDGDNWDSTFPVAGFNISSGISAFHTAVKLGRYFRVRIVNDATADQTYLRLTTYYGNNFIPGVSPYNQSLRIDADAQATRPSNFYDEVVTARRPGVSHFNKFGYRATLSAAGGEETIWATTGNFTPITTASTFTITYNSGTDGDGTTGATQLTFYYIDANGLDAIAAHTLGSTGSDVTSFTGLGINRVAISASGSAQVNTNNITVTATTGGTTQAIVPALEGVTQQAIFHVDTNSRAVAKFLWINCNKISGGGSPRITVKAYIFNRTIETRFEVFRITIDTAVENTVVIEEPIGFALSPGDILYFVGDTDTNSTIANVRFSLVEYKID